MPTDFKISVNAASREDGYRILTLSVTNVNNDFEYKMYIFDHNLLGTKKRLISLDEKYV